MFIEYAAAGQACWFQGKFVMVERKEPKCRSKADRKLDWSFIGKQKPRAGLTKN